MRKKMCAGLSLVLCMGALSGCSNKTAVDTSTVFVEKKGRIVSVDVEKLDKDYYDTTELEEYIADYVTNYTSEHGDTVEQVSFEVEEGTAKLQMEYDTYEDYSSFNGIELYTGTVVKAQAAGYDFDTEFMAASKDSEDESKGQTVDKSEVLSDDENKVVVIKANVDVSVPGKILYVSTQNTEVTGKDTVSIKGEDAEAEAALTYIIYK